MSHDMKSAHQAWSQNLFKAAAEAPVEPSPEFVSRVLERIAADPGPGSASLSASWKIVAGIVAVLSTPFLLKGLPKPPGPESAGVEKTESRSKGRSNSLPSEKVPETAAGLAPDDRLKAEAMGWTAKTGPLELEVPVSVEVSWAHLETPPSQVEILLPDHLEFHSEAHPELARLRSLARKIEPGERSFPMIVKANRAGTVEIRFQWKGENGFRPQESRLKLVFGGKP